MRRSALLAGAATLALGLVAMQPTANAAVISVLASQPFSATPITISLSGGTGSLSFTLDNTGFFPMSSVATGGTARVTTIFGGIADFGTGAPIDGTMLYSFASYPAAASIPNSSAMDFIGFSYNGVDGVHYGYAEVFGSTFVGYAYESAANTTITTQEVTASTAVPEPVSAALLVTGLAAIGLVRRTKRSVQPSQAA